MNRVGVGGLWTNYPILIAQASDPRQTIRSISLQKLDLANLKGNFRSNSPQHFKSPQNLKSAEPQPMFMGEFKCVHCQVEFTQDNPIGYLYLRERVFMNESEKRQDVVLLLHGIRTRAWWQGALSKMIEEETDTVVIPIKYGHFDLVRFLLPFQFLKRPTIAKIEKRIEDALHQYPKSNVTIIAHSFGTYALSEILLKNPRISLRRIILCGSIIRKNFPWDRLYTQIASVNSRSSIVNECGLKDVWPLTAESVTWGYGSSGVDGFGTIGVRDRFHNLGHSDFLTIEFAKKYWLPLITSGEIVASDADGEKPSALLGILRLPYRYVPVIALMIAAFMTLDPYVWHKPIIEELAITRGLAKVSAPTNSLVMYAASPGDVALDVNPIDMQSSPFSYALTRAMRGGSSQIGDIIPAVAKSVASQTKGVQVPHYDNRLGHDLNLSRSEYSKIAIVIGNANYAHLPSLTTPHADVTIVSDAFRRVGFLTVIAQDVNRKEFLDVLDQISSLAANSDKPLILAFYYAGHGIQIEQTNYLVPVNSEISSQEDAQSMAISTASIYNALRSSKVHHLLLFFDACRDNPFAPVKRTASTIEPIDPVSSNVEGFTVFLDDNMLQNRMQKVFESHCISCHGDSSKTPTNKGAIPKVGDLKDLFPSTELKGAQVIKVLQDEKDHPRIELTLDEVELIACWIDRGQPSRNAGNEVRGIKIIAKEHAKC